MITTGLIRNQAACASVIANISSHRLLALAEAKLSLREDVIFSMDMKKMNLSDRIIYILGLTLAGVLTFVVVAGVIVAVLKFYMDSKERTIQVQPGPALKDDPKLPSGNVSTGRHLSEDVNGQVNDEQEKPPN